MKPHQLSIFEDSPRLQFHEAMDLTIQSMQAYGPSHDHWGIAWSGGKDSTATLTVICHLLDIQAIQRPQSLTVFYADTRMEMPPLELAARQTISDLRQKGIDVNIVCAQMDDRFLVYILGRGVPPPNNMTFRWCTGQIKIEPMQQAIATHLDNIGGTMLMITGVRQGESAIRDRRIEMSCGKDGAECGQGWYQEVLPNAKGLRGRIATLAPLLHWRVCQVWDWLKFYAPSEDYGSWQTSMLADAYGGDEALEINARTGCICCPLAQKDTALEYICAQPKWAYLTPLLGLRSIYRRLREPANRLRKSGIELNKQGGIGANPQRMGPLTLYARKTALTDILSIQNEINTYAMQHDRPLIQIINYDEELRIRELIEQNTWPNKWTGEEPLATLPMDKIYADGSVQPLLF